MFVFVIKCHQPEKCFCCFAYMEILCLRLVQHIIDSYSYNLCGEQNSFATHHMNTCIGGLVSGLHSRNVGVENGLLRMIGFGMINMHSACGNS